MFYVIQGLVLVGLVASFREYNRHRRVVPLIISIICTTAIIYGINHMFDTYYIYGGIIGLLCMSVWNTVESRRSVVVRGESQSDRAT